MADFTPNLNTIYLKIETKAKLINLNLWKYHFTNDISKGAVLMIIGI